MNENPSFEFPTFGKYSVTLIATNNFNSDTSIQQILIETSPIASFTFTTNQKKVIFTNKSINAQKYKWYFGTGDSSIAQHPTYDYPTNGSYHITLIAYNHYSSDTIVNDISITSKPNADFTYFSDQRHVDFINNSSEANKYKWYFTMIDSSNEKSPSFDFSKNGIYLVQLIALNPYGSDTNCQQISIEANPIADFEYDIQYQKVTFKSLALDADKHTWNFGDHSFSNEENPTNTYQDLGSYKVTLLVTNQFGTDSSFKIINIENTSLTQLFLFPNALKIYPNPTNDFIFLEFNKNVSAELLVVEILNLNGKIVKKADLLSVELNKTLKIDVTALPKGSYYLRIKNDKSELIRRFVKY